jgi:hypothetical protein
VLIVNSTSCQKTEWNFITEMGIITTRVAKTWHCCVVTVTTRYTQQQRSPRQVFLTRNQVGEEPDDFNESSPVLKPSQGGDSLA